MMKITKQRLKEIIKEEITSMEEGVFSSLTRARAAQTNLASVQKVEKLVRSLVDEFNNAESAEEKKEIQGRIQALVKAVSHIQEGPRDEDAMHGARRPGPGIEDYPEPEEDEDPMASRLGTREEQLLSRILARAVVDKYDSYEDLANDLGLELDIRMLNWLQALRANPMYGSSGMEEGKVSGHRSEVTYSKSKRGKSKKPEKKAYNKAARAQAKKDLKK
jgi:hypothetical protein